MLLRHSIQEKNRELLVWLCLDEAEAWTAFRVRHAKTLNQSCRRKVREALKRTTHFESYQVFDQESAFFSQYVVALAFAELFCQALRNQRMLRGLDDARKEEIRSDQILYMLAERYLAEQTDRKDRAQQKAQRVASALQLAARWRRACIDENSGDDISIPTQTELEPILVRLWFYRCCEVLKSWIRDQESKELPLPTTGTESILDDQEMAKEGHGDSANASNAHREIERWNWCERVLFLVIRDAIDQAIWKGKLSDQTEIEIAAQLEAQRGEETNSGEGQPWTRGKVASRWNALARRMATLVQLLESYEDHPRDPAMITGLEKWRALQQEDVLVPHGWEKIPVEARHLLVHLHNPKNLDILRVALTFWLLTQTLQATQEIHVHIAWGQIVQYWLLGHDCLTQNAPGASGVTQFWAEEHGLYG